ncbi:hypothetical protein WT88_29655 [Burkholderia stagnalis]|uniref:hypothetical protein n=1 Tax=Burkholderia stagnalis TaxID=1503054 RepID=UPI000754C7CA|nr:hypothetical protein [Burkholderia stagnalis]KVZ18648.1 hypothetical protein WT35_04595 [Burkholderia stagnalis]KWN32871.1 hypothetical protein WT86_18720 [Burkholderia stagnalis]KWN44698.1 hypothetical protein WT88_29655 [Burkholderia stagnalis]KWN54431.1 hypothetical protein WT87_03750 [Burkholderia stagnalis]KWO68838.1 hypothetical protein WT99_21120 [Burkholderia stagnalis]
MSRFQLMFVWLLCVLATPILLVAMLAEALFGSTERAKNIAIAEDEAGNSLFGGPPTQTISERTGNALIEGQRWAHFVAPCIDLLFGKGHCLANATIAPK